MSYIEPRANFQELIIQLQKQYISLKKVKIFKAVNRAYKKVKPLISEITEQEFKRIRSIAAADLYY